jgi:hypothetical protein
MQAHMDAALSDAALIVRCEFYGAGEGRGFGAKPNARAVCFAGHGECCLSGVVIP